MKSVRQETVAHGGFQRALKQGAPRDNHRVLSNYQTTGRASHTWARVAKGKRETHGGRREPQVLTECAKINKLIKGVWSARNGGAQQEGTERSRGHRTPLTSDTRARE